MLQQTWRTLFHAYFANEIHFKGSLTQLSLIMKYSNTVILSQCRGQGEMNQKT